MSIDRGERTSLETSRKVKDLPSDQILKDKTDSPGYTVSKAPTCKQIYGRPRDIVNGGRRGNETGAVEDDRALIVEININNCSHPLHLQAT